MFSLNAIEIAYIDHSTILMSYKIWIQWAKENFVDSQIIPTVNKCSNMFMGKLKTDANQEISKIRDKISINLVCSSENYPRIRWETKRQATLIKDLFTKLGKWTWIGVHFLKPWFDSLILNYWMTEKDFFFPKDPRQDSQIRTTISIKSSELNNFLEKTLSIFSHSGDGLLTGCSVPQFIFYSLFRMRPTSIDHFIKDLFFHSRKPFFTFYKFSLVLFGAPTPSNERRG